MVWDHTVMKCSQSELIARRSSLAAGRRSRASLTGAERLITGK